MLNSWGLDWALKKMGKNEIKRKKFHLVSEGDIFIIFFCP
jgi:hypothetical protein